MSSAVARPPSSSPPSSELGDDEFATVLSRNRGNFSSPAIPSLAPNRGSSGRSSTNVDVTRPKRKFNSYRTAPSPDPIQPGSRLHGGSRQQHLRDGGRSNDSAQRHTSRDRDRGDQRERGQHSHRGDRQDGHRYDKSSSDRDFSSRPQSSRLDRSEADKPTERLQPPLAVNPLSTTNVIKSQSGAMYHRSPISSPKAKATAASDFGATTASATSSAAASGDSAAHRYTRAFLLAMQHKAVTNPLKILPEVTKPGKKSYDDEAPPVAAARAPPPGFGDSGVSAERRWRDNGSSRDFNGSRDNGGSRARRPSDKDSIGETADTGGRRWVDEKRDRWKEQQQVEEPRHHGGGRHNDRRYDENVVPEWADEEPNTDFNFDFASAVLDRDGDRAQAKRMGIDMLESAALGDSLEPDSDFGAFSGASESGMSIAQQIEAEKAAFKAKIAAEEKKAREEREQELAEVQDSLHYMASPATSGDSHAASNPTYKSSDPTQSRLASFLFMGSDAHNDQFTAFSSSFSKPSTPPGLSRIDPPQHAAENNEYNGQAPAAAAKALQASDLFAMFSGNSGAALPKLPENAPSNYYGQSIQPTHMQPQYQPQHQAPPSELSAAAPTSQQRQYSSPAQPLQPQYTQPQYQYSPQQQASAPPAATQQYAPDPRYQQQQYQPSAAPASGAAPPPGTSPFAWTSLQDAQQRATQQQRHQALSHLYRQQPAMDSDNYKPPAPRVSPRVRANPNTLPAHYYQQQPASTTYHPSSYQHYLLNKDNQDPNESPDSLSNGGADASVGDNLARLLNKSRARKAGVNQTPPPMSTPYGQTSSPYSQYQQQQQQSAGPPAPYDPQYGSNLQSQLQSPARGGNAASAAALIGQQFHPQAPTPPISYQQHGSVGNNGQRSYPAPIPHPGQQTVHLTPDQSRALLYAQAFPNQPLPNSLLQHMPQNFHTNPYQVDGQSQRQPAQPRTPQSAYAQR